MYPSDSPFSSGSSTSSWPLHADNTPQRSQQQSQQSLTTNFGASLSSEAQFPQQHLGSDTSPARLLYGHIHAQNQFSSSLLNSAHSPLPENPHPSGPSLGELLSYPVVQGLYNQVVVANMHMARALESQGSLQAEILRLTRLLQPEIGTRYAENRSARSFISLIESLLTVTVINVYLTSLINRV